MKQVANKTLNVTLSMPRKKVRAWAVQDKIGLLFWEHEQFAVQSYNAVSVYFTSKQIMP